jgi:catechol 2,3-dioxygenase-like lactoylglutathione lyase family enzyme
MIGYVTLGTNDFARACAFYDALLAEIGIPRLMSFPRGQAWGHSMAQPSLAIMLPFDEQPASPGNGVMVAIPVLEPAQVQRVYDRAIALGAQDEGAPGPRGNSGFYAAYFRDLDGNKLNVFCMAAAAAG